MNNDPNWSNRNLWNPYALEAENNILGIGEHMKKIKPFNVAYIVEFHGVTMTDDVLTFTPTMGADSIGDLLDRLVKSGAIEGYTITVKRDGDDNYKRSKGE